jgi:hypothetical protein
MNNENDLIPITRPSTNINVPLQLKQSESPKWPTETLDDLPTCGWFYPEDHPLSSGKIELKQVTSLQEDILSNDNLIRKGTALEKFIESLIVDKRINVKDIFLSDKNAILIFCRRLAYGDTYDASVKCPNCLSDNSVSIDLSKLKNKKIDFEKYPKHVNLFEFELPYSKRTIRFKLLTQKEADLIDQEIESFKKINKESSKEVSTRLIHIIQSIDGDTNKANIRNFVTGELLSKDSLALRKYIREISPDIVTDFDFECTSCGYKGLFPLPITPSFFYPDLR